jgi:TPR repeat protein
MKRRQHDVALARVLALCEGGHPEACFAGAKYMAQLRVKSRLGSTPQGLRERAQQAYEQKCTAGDAAMCFEYGRLLVHGKYVAADPLRGHELVDKACGLANANACALLGRMYARGEIVKRDPKRATALFERACTGGSGTACTSLADQLAQSNRKRAVSLYETACAADDATGCAKAGQSAQRAGAAARAVELLAKACELDDLASCAPAGKLLVAGKGGAADPARARELFASGCEADIGAACAGLAPLIATGIGGPRNWAKGIELAHKACTLKTPRACELEKRIARQPPDVTCATVDACTTICDDERIPKACVQAAELALAAGTSEEDCGSATMHVVKACEVGDNASCVKAGNLESHADEAVSWYSRACDGKLASACVLRDAAILTTRSESETPRATATLRRACKARNWLACAWIGYHVERGAAGERMLRDACDRGHGRACRYLAVVYGGVSFGGVGDGSHQPIDPRGAPLLRKGCELGDVRACGLSHDESVKPSRAPSCGEDPSWEPLL